jgi:hypothetical protein
VPVTQNISRSRYGGGIGVARPHIADGLKNGKDDLVTERISASRPTSDYTPQLSPDQLSVGSATAPPANDSPLLALEKQFNAISAELLAVQRLRRDQKRAHGPAAQPPEQTTIESCVGAHTYDEVVTQQIESVLARLYPIERAIMQTPACSIAGLGVKARHAAYVMSQYWEAPIDRIDWDAQAVRLLIESVCDFARTPLPFRNVSGEE